MTEEDPPTVVVAEDEQELADLYYFWLADRYDVRVAYGGKETLERVDDGVDVLLLDRRMPGLHGDEVLGRLRERGYDGWVVMVTAISPTVDIIELPFDDYLCKPITREDLVRTVDGLLERDRYASKLRTYARLAVKRATLTAEHSERELADSEAYRALEERLEEVREEVAASTEGFGDGDFEDAFRRL